MTQIRMEMMKLEEKMLKMRKLMMTIYHQIMTQNFIEMKKLKRMLWKIKLIMKNHQKLTKWPKNIFTFTYKEGKGTNIKPFKAGNS